MKDKRQRLQSMVWPYNMAAAVAAAAAAADQSGLYAYMMQSSLLHAQYPYSHTIPLTQASRVSSSCSPGSATVALAAALQSSGVPLPLSYLADRPVPLPRGSCSDRMSQFPATHDYDAVYASVIAAATRQRAMLAAAIDTGSVVSCSDSSKSTSLFRPYQSTYQVDGDASD